MIGDTAGLIHPLETEWRWLFIVQNWLQKYNTFSRKRINRSTLENDYLNDWKKILKRLQQVVYWETITT
jgi:hypothetical protein